ncbi:MAG: GTPase HflX [Phycisphaeraceae bacterium]|nr:GTPase HflX [Phycisphaeraceae bacterium]
MPAPKERQTIQVATERAVLAAVRLPDSTYDQANPFGELRSLAAQAGAEVVGEAEQRRQRPEAGTFMGTGKLRELKGLCDELRASVVIFDHDLSPKQLANIEKIVERKVIDRSELILDIFAGRAATHEAKLAVELAQLQYTYPRLRAMWDHLERIVGGAGGIAGVGTRGPGEQQLEIDRRLVQRRRLMLQAELEQIQARKRRMVQERKRDHFTIGIVGYTNAGKSTLFNALTAGGAYADDRLFATLVTRTREWTLAPGVSAMLSDTVGFVRDLPHHLIASFRATLEEATHADVLLIVLDVSDPAAEMQYRTVIDTLDELEADVLRDERKAVKRGDSDAYIVEDRGEWRASRTEQTDPDRDEHDKHSIRPSPSPDSDVRPPNHADAARDRVATSWQPPKRIVLLNKADKLADNRNLLVWLRQVPDAIPISAKQGPPDGLGFAALTDRLLTEVRGGDGSDADGGLIEAEISLPMADGRTMQRLETKAEVLDRAYEGDTATVRVRIGRRQLSQVLTGTRGVSVRELGPAGRAHA